MNHWNSDGLAEQGVRPGARLKNLTHGELTLLMDSNDLQEICHGNEEIRMALKLLDIVNKHGLAVLN